MSDRVILEKAEAHVLFTTWQITKQKVLTPERCNRLVKLYGSGAIERITNYMKAERDEAETIQRSTGASGNN